MTCVNHHLTPRPAALETRLVPRVELCLRWTVRNGRLTSHWCREPHDLAEDGARLVSCVAA
jgi:hypothetical protein